MNRLTQLRRWLKNTGILPWLSVAAVVVAVVALAIAAHMARGVFIFAGVLVLVLLLALLLRAIRDLVNGGFPSQPFQIILAVLGLVLVILWIGQGVLASQMSMGLAGLVQEVE